MSSSSQHPIIFHKGKKTKRQLKRLKKGRGRTADSVARIMDRTQESVGDSKIVVPIIIAYKKKKGSSGSSKTTNPLNFFTGNLS